jgi:hypothetical protein
MSRLLIRNHKPNFRSGVHVIIGRRATGKTVLTSDLLFKSRLRFGLIFDPIQYTYPGRTRWNTTEDGGPYDFIKKEFKYNDIEEDVLERFIKVQKRRAQRGKKAFIVFDNCMFERKVLRGEYFRRLIMDARHIKCYVLLCITYPTALPPALRAQASTTFILQENSNRARQQLHQNWAGCIPTLGDFNTILDAVTQDYHCLVIDHENHRASVQRYKGEPRPKTLGKWSRLARRLYSRYCLEQVTQLPLELIDMISTDVRENEPRFDFAKLLRFYKVRM